MSIAEQERFYREWLMKRRAKSVWVTLAQHRACLFLIRHGFRFMVDFGYGNAQAKAQLVRQGYQP